MVVPMKFKTWQNFFFRVSQTGDFKGHLTLNAASNEIREEKSNIFHKYVQGVSDISHNHDM